MANAEITEEDVPKKSGKMGLIIGLVLALIAGGGGFFAAYSGALPGSKSSSSSVEDDKPVALEPLPQAAFVPLDPLIVNIRSSSQYKLLRFTGQLEVEPASVTDFELLKPDHNCSDVSKL